MWQPTPIEAFVKTRMAELGLSRGELGQRLGHNTNKALRRLDQLMHEGISGHPDFTAHLATALEVPSDALRQTINAQNQSEAKAAEAAYRAAFKPHAIWQTEHSRPTSISMAAWINAPAYLHLPFPTNLVDSDYIRFCQDNAPAVIPFFGRVTGFTINYQPDHAVVYALDGQILETLDRAPQLPIAGLRL